MNLFDLLFGRRLANREGMQRKIGWFAGVPAMGLDALGSSSCGPEAALTIMIPLGAASLAYIGWVIAAIVLLLAFLYVSYRQTIVAYPSHGGAYTVARENLGDLGALAAAAALMIDYVLNVAVGISAGVGALTSSVPPLQPYTLPLCLGILLLIAGGYQSVLSQLAAAIVGRGTLYYIAMGSLLAVLCLSANTSFVDFPRVCHLVARDSYLPRGFARSDRRLVYSVGVGFLTATAGGLLIVFGGITDRLIPLFAIGAFLTFTISQTGMIVHWRKQRQRHSGRLAINAAGAVMTVVALAVIGAAKFADGGWIAIGAIPLLILLMSTIHRVYRKEDALLACDSAIRIDEREPPTVMVTYEDRSRMTDRALRFAMTLSPNVIAVHLLHLEGPDEDENMAGIRERFEREIEEPLAAAGETPPRLVMVPAPYRQIYGPLLDLVDKIDAERPAGPSPSSSPSWSCRTDGSACSTAAAPSGCEQS
jgi:amino acid transporter